MIYVLRVTIIKMYLQLATNFRTQVYKYKYSATNFKQLLWRLSSIDFFKSGKNLTIGNLTDQ